MVTNSLTPGKLHSKYIYSSRKNKSDKILSAAVIPRGQLHDIQRYKGISLLTIVETVAAKQRCHETF